VSDFVDRNRKYSPKSGFWAMGAQEVEEGVSLGLFLEERKGGYSLSWTLEDRWYLVIA